jgi:hypothetical protein
MTPEKIIEIAHETVRLTWINDSPEDLIAFAQSVIEAERESSDKPVAWVSCDGYLSHYRLGDEYIPLYRRPLPMARLTDEEISQVGEVSKSVEGDHILPFAFARAIEQKIWEKAE